MNPPRVALGLSGGVDSSVAAALLIEQRYEVTGIYLECYNEPGCRTDQDKKDALQVALKLGIKFEVLDFRKEYKEKVIEYFYHEYAVGRTPNPDVMCNREIKFGIFYDWAIQNGFDYVATGHYARIADLSGVSRKALQMAVDESKDQSYFLWQIPSKHLSRIIFPLGEMLKTEVRAKAKALGLQTASKPDSMGICFIGEVDVGKLLQAKLGEKPGEVVMKDVSQPQVQYMCVGKHKGLWFYTIGQRGGWEIDPKIQKSNMEPLYVIGKNIQRNELIVGKRDEAMRKQFEIEDKTLTVARSKMWSVRIRNLGELYAVERIEHGVVTLRDEVFAPSQGQSSVFYDKTQVLVGGSIIV